MLTQHVSYVNYLFVLKNYSIYGEILLLSFVLISSTQEVFLGHYTQGKDPLALVGSIFLITVVFYVLIHIKHFELLVKAVKNNQSTIFCLN